MNLYRSIINKVDKKRIAEEERVNVMFLGATFKSCNKKNFSLKIL